MAADSVSMDALLADAVRKLDALNTRMDALETGTGSKNPIAKGDDDDDDKAKKRDSSGAKAKSDDDDDGGKKDDATTPKTHIKDDDDDDKKDDAAEPPPPMKSDAKKRGDDGELEIKHEPEKRGDKKKADAAKKADDDDDDKRDDVEEEKEKKEDAVKIDSVADLRQRLLSQQAIIDRLQLQMKPRSDDEHAAFAEAQAKADSVFNGFGKRAPRPLEGEGFLDYRKRLATDLKKYSDRWKSIKLSKLDAETFTPIEEQVYADAITAAAHPLDLAPGELRAVTKTNPTTGVRTIEFYGKESFVKGMGRPGRRVQSFRTLASQ